MHAIGTGVRKQPRELPCGFAICFLLRLGHRELAGSINGSFNLIEAYRVSLAARPLRLVTVDLGKARDAVPLQSSMQRKASEVRDRGLQGVEAIIERQSNVPPASNDGRLFPFAENG